jgi:hypothetical protein
MTTFLNRNPNPNPEDTYKCLRCPEDVKLNCKCLKCGIPECHRCLEEFNAVTKCDRFSIRKDLQTFARSRK